MGARWREQTRQPRRAHARPLGETASLCVVATHRQVGQVAAAGVPLREGGARCLGIDKGPSLCGQVVLRQAVQAAGAAVAPCWAWCGVTRARGRSRAAACACSGQAGSLDPGTQAQRRRLPRPRRAADGSASALGGVGSGTARRVAGAGRRVHDPRHRSGLVCFTPSAHSCSDSLLRRCFTAQARLQAQREQTRHTTGFAVTRWQLRRTEAPVAMHACGQVPAPAQLAGRRVALVRTSVTCAPPVEVSPASLRSTSRPPPGAAHTAASHDRDGSSSSRRRGVLLATPLLLLAQGSSGPHACAATDQASSPDAGAALPVARYTDAKNHFALGACVAAVWVSLCVCLSSGRTLPSAFRSLTLSPRCVPPSLLQSTRPSGRPHRRTAPRCCSRTRGTG